MSTRHFADPSWENELNTAQLEAVKSIYGPHLIIAGAGSGKTRVLVYRVAYLVQQAILPDEILLLTFTRKAAQEMLRRAALLLDGRCQKVAGGTFHSFANMIIRRNASLLALPNNFIILDQSDAEDTINLIRTELGFSKSKERFPRKDTLLEIISKSINKSQKLGEVIYDNYPQFLHLEPQIKKIWDEYVKYKQAKFLLDYDDLLVNLKNLLSIHTSLRHSLSRKYKFIMVDEYQDTNRLQAEIIYLLSAEHKNIMVVGDDSQSIYSFRGANFKNIIDFPKIFKDTKIITLEQNYRSTQPILNLTNEVISYAEEKFEKHLFTKKPSVNLPVFIDAEDESAQSRYVADKILELREEGVELSDIAVLFRSGWHSNDLEVELASRNIPFVKYGGQKFVEAAHIKDILSFLRITYNLSDTVSWYRALLLMQGVGPKTAAAIISEIMADKNRLVVSESLIRKSRDLSVFLETLKKVLPENYRPSELIRIFLDYYQPLLKEKYDDYNKRLNDLDSLEHIASRYNSLEEFLADMALEPPERSIVERARKDRDDSPLTLSTIHSAKGLEWHSVFLIYVAEGHLPSYLSLEDKEAVEEERRLFYVAMTRAKENLFLIKPQTERTFRSYLSNSGSSIVFTEISRFLAEGDILNKLLDVEAATSPSDFDEINLEDIFG